MKAGNNTSRLAAECMGTGVLSLLVISVTKSTLGVPLFIALAGGIATAGLLFILGSPATVLQFNPAITIGFAVHKIIRPMTAFLNIVAQLTGAFIACRLYGYFTAQSWSNAGKFNSRVLVAEAVAGFLLALGYAAANYFSLTSQRAVAAGVAYTIAVLSVSGAGIAIVNPATALSLGSWVWGSYVLGPVIGAIAGMWAYTLFGNLHPQIMNSKTVQNESKNERKKAVERS